MVLDNRYRSSKYLENIKQVVDLAKMYPQYDIILKSLCKTYNLNNAIEKLEQKGVTNIPHFGPLYRFAAVKEMGLDPEAAAASCPVCEEVFDRCFTHLPIYGLSDEQLKYMADAILESVKEMQEGR